VSAVDAVIDRAYDKEHALMRKAMLRALRLGVLSLMTAGVPAARAAGRVLIPMDIVVIRVVNEPDLETTTRVEPDGTINFPYVGRIKAAGLTEDELARAVERRLIELRIVANP
jgi:protein involved in polysaccharide export with SLBB domain